MFWKYRRHIVAELILDNLGFTYPGNESPTLSGLNVHIQDGATHALLGASGAGKTTILNLLSGLLHPSEGRILFDGHDVSALDARGRNVALVFQFPVLYESKSVVDNLAFPLLNRGWKRRDALHRAREIGGELGISDVLDSRPAGLSLFQKQLAAIGKSLVRTDVDLVLLDEPLTAVEPATKWRLRQTLTRFQQTHALTMIYVTHDQTEALTFANEVSVLSEGRILQTASPDEIYNNPADPFVAGFIGSPGMKLINCELNEGRITPDGFPDFDLPDGHYQLGVRAEWLTPVLSEAGPWQVTGTNLLGTRNGQKRSLVRVKGEPGELIAEGDGEFPIGQAVSVSASRAVLFEAEQ